MCVLILHYHEIWLKGGNRNFFLQNLRRASKRALEGLHVKRTIWEDHRLIITFEDDNMAHCGIERLRKVPGIAYVAVAEQTNPDLDSIIDTGSRLMRTAEFHSFRVRARRSQKSLPFRSVDIGRQLGARIWTDAVANGRKVKVDLSNAEATCYVDVTTSRALLYREKIPGMGGLPTGSAGKLTCLLSGGFDSAVAAYKVIKRGVRLSFVHFWGRAARPGEESSPVARRLVRALTPYQGRSRFYLIPFDEIQREIVVAAPQGYRILLYRRIMLRIAERIAYREHSHGLVTGDSISQVASQTLKNMEAVGAAASLPIYRPVVGDDKQEIIDLARRIGTYKISCEPFSDCCPMYLPKSPKIHSTAAELDNIEADLPIKDWITKGLRAASKEVYEWRAGEVSLLKKHDHEFSPPIRR
jgi:thiamine biosynthesis protein ThiI